MHRRWRWLTLALAGILTLGALALVSLLRPEWIGRTTPEQLARQADRVLARRLGPLGEAWTGDLPQIRGARRFLRVLVSYSRTNFFVDGDDLRGLEYEMMLQFEEYLNRNAPGSADRLALVFIPIPFGQLLSALEQGKGDLVAAGLSVTPERQKRVAFARPYMKHVREVVVLGPDARPVQTLDDLAGRSVHVVAGGSAAEHLAALNTTLAAKNRDAIRVVQAEPYMEAGDLLHLVSVGAWNYAVTDLHLAQLWAAALPGLTVREDLVVHSGGQLAWAVRKDCPKLLAELSAFARTVRQGTQLGNVLQRRYLTPGVRSLSGADNDEISRFRSLEPHFRHFAEALHFDWLRLAAVAYQESRFHQDKISPAGAIGVMQVLPSTAKIPVVNVRNIHTARGNIQAGARYLAHLRDDVFNDPELPQTARMNFVIAAYNAGPTRIQDLRRQAQTLGLDPNRWFGSVESLAAAQIGRETVEYVLAVNKYYAILAGLADYMTRLEATDEF